MSTTTAQQIVTAAINRSLLNDAGADDLASDQSGELLGVLSRLVRGIYFDAAEVALLDQSAGAYFSTTGTLTVGTPSSTPVTLPATPQCLYVIRVTTNTGAPVRIGSIQDLREGTLDYPPAVALTNQQLRSGGRTGDPVAGAVLTLDYAYAPPALALLTDYIGATTPATASTSAWPDWVGDPYLIDMLAHYLAIKDPARDPSAVAALEASIAKHGEALGRVVGVQAAALARVSAA